MSFWEEVKFFFKHFKLPLCQCRCGKYIKDYAEWQEHQKTHQPDFKEKDK